MHAKIVSLQPPAQRDAMATLGLDKPDERTLTVCQERVTFEMISCVDRAKSLDQALACHSSADIRPPNARRTREECARYVGHVREIVESSNPSTTVRDNMVAAATSECDGWLTVERFDCTMRATTAREWADCPP